MAKKVKHFLSCFREQLSLQVPTLLTLCQSSFPSFLLFFMIQRPWARTLETARLMLSHPMCLWVSDQKWTLPLLICVHMLPYIVINVCVHSCCMHWILTICIYKERVSTYGLCGLGALSIHYYYSISSRQPLLWLVLCYVLLCVSTPLAVRPCLTSCVRPFIRCLW